MTEPQGFLPAPLLGVCLGVLQSAGAEVGAVCVSSAVRAVGCLTAKGKDLFSTTRSPPHPPHVTTTTTALTLGPGGLHCLS